MSDAAYFLILDGETGNSLASFEDAKEARECFLGMAQEHPSRAETLALMSFDRDGFALDTELVEDVREYA